MQDDVSLPTWVAEAAALPVAFAQVREDPLLDVAVVRRHGPAARVMMIASGGCTVAYLAACSGAASIDVVDPNPAQIALARLKLHLLQTCGTAERLALLGHAPVDATDRERRLCAAMHELGVSPDAIGPTHAWAADGPDHAGRYERVFAQLRRNLEPQRAAIQQVLSLRNPAEQAVSTATDTPLGQALDEAFDRAMDLPILVGLFGEGATRNRAEPFSQHFARRTRHALATLPAADNPYLWQVLAGRYPPGSVAPWLSMSPPDKAPQISWHNMLMADALRSSPGGYDFIQLSNILDWLSVDEARATLDLARAALRPGGQTLIRQLNSTLDIPGCGEGFAWQTAESQAMHAADRSYFYRALHLGTKP